MLWYFTTTIEQPQHVLNKFFPSLGQTCIHPVQDGEANDAVIVSKMTYIIFLGAVYNAEKGGVFEQILCSLNFQDSPMVKL